MNVLPRLLILAAVIAPRPAPADLAPPLEVAWQFRHDPGFYAAPTVAGEVVYASALDGQVFALGAADGAVRWVTDIGDKLYAGVAVGAGLVVTAGTDRAVYALDAATGAVRWKHELDGLAYAAPAVAGGRVHVGTGETGTLLCLNAADGAEVWRYAMGGRLGSGLVIADGTVYAGSHDRLLHVLDAATGERRWSFETDGIVDSPPLVAGGRVYLKLPDDTVYALEADDGQVIWESRSPEPPIAPTQVSNWSSLTLADGLLLFGSIDQHLYALDAATGERRWGSAGDADWPAAPAVADAWLFAGSKDGSLSGLERASGRIAWRWTIKQDAADPYLRGIMFTPVIAGDRLYVASMDGAVTCFRGTGAEPARVEPPAAEERPAVPAVEPPAAAAAHLDRPGAPAWKLSFDIAAGLLWPAEARAAARFDQTEAGDGYELSVMLGRVRLTRRDGGRDVVLADRATPRTPAHVTVHRDGARIRALYDGQPVLSVHDGTYQDGPIDLTAEGGLRLGGAALQPLEEVWFEDDFMRAKGEEHGDWRPVSGTWVTSGVSEENVRREEDHRPDPDFSSNPFAYRADDVDSEALATAGHWFWGEYEAEVSVRPGERRDGAAGPGSIGLALLVADGGDCLRFEWDHAGAGGERRLVAISGGRRKLLDRADGGWDDDQWYRLGASVTDDRCDVTIDGRRVLSTREVDRGQGRLGLWASEVTFADFDDVRVETIGRLDDRFGAPDDLRWQAAAGAWTVDAAAPGHFDPGVLVLQSGDGLALADCPAWGNVRYAAVGRAARGGGLGLLLLDDEGTGIGLRCGDAWGSQAQVFARGGDGEAVLAQVDRPLDPALWHRLELVLRDGLATATIDGDTIATVAALGLEPTRLGLAGAGEVTGFDAAVLDPLPPSEPLQFAPPVAPQFAEEALMASWASPDGAWRPDQAGERGGVIWHRGRFHGGREVGLRRELLAAQRELLVVLAGDGQSSDAGISALVKLADENRATIELRLAGATFATVALPLDDLDAIGIGLRDGYATIRADRETVAAEPLPRAVAPGWTAVGVAARPELDLGGLAVCAPQAFDTTFQRAPVEWRVGAGVWETTNRWKCDPRWSFFGSQKGEHPIVWSKDAFSGDLQMEAYVGLLMDSKAAPYYLNAADLGIILCGDGQSPASGYDLRFAAQQNTCTLLLRNGEEIARNNAAEARFKYVNPEGEGLIEFHRHWFHLVLRRAGGRLTAWVDDHLLIDVPDERPLAGGHVALYTINNGLSVSRVKVYSSGSGARGAGWNAAEWRGVEGDVGATAQPDEPTARGRGRRH